MPYTEELGQLWQKTLEKMSDIIPKATVENLFYDIKMESFDGEVAVISIHSEYKHSLIAKKYLEKLRKIISGFADKQLTLSLLYSGPSQFYIDQLEVEYKIRPGEKPVVTCEPPEEAPPANDYMKARLSYSMPPINAEYTFENFIVGNSNKFAHAACTAVAARPATDYNPLFIYGPSGLGKTHLLYAITNEIARKKPDINIIYVKGEDFTNQLIESIKDQTTEKFRQKYRNCDVLLIDDIQFIAGKVSTQEEFFHTFNALHDEHKQIILTSDRPPSEIKQLEYRLKTRFEWGLIADIEPPEFELRLAIIKKKAERAECKLPDDVAEFLAENLRTNIRQAEGALNKLQALSFLKGLPITMEMARGCVSELLGGAEPVSVTVDKIFSKVFKKYGIPKEDIVGTRRTKEIAFARHVTIYLISTVTGMSENNMGKLLNRDHSTINASKEVIERKLRTDSIFNIEIEEMIKEINGN